MVSIYYGVLSNGRRLCRVLYLKRLLNVYQVYLLIRGESMEVTRVRLPLSRVVGFTVILFAITSIIALASTLPVSIGQDPASTITIQSYGSTRNISVYFFGSGAEAFEEVLKATIRPHLSVSYNGYVVDVYYYHPEVHGSDKQRAVFDPISFLVNVVENICKWTEFKEKTHTVMSTTDLSLVMKAEKLEEELKSRVFRYLLYCPSKGVVFAGVKKGDTSSILYYVELLADNILSLSPTQYNAIIVYGLEYGVDEKPLDVNRTSYYVLDDIMRRKYGLNLDSMIIGGKRRIIVSENILTGRPLLFVNTTLYLEMLNVSYKDSRIIAYRVGLAVAKALEQAQFPFKHVDIVIHYNPSARVVSNVEQRVVKNLKEQKSQIRKVVDGVTCKEDFLNTTSYHVGKAETVDVKAASTNSYVGQANSLPRKLEGENGAATLLVLVLLVGIIAFLCLVFCSRMTSRG